MSGISEGEYICSNCGYETDSKIGLGVHKTRLHEYDFRERFWINVDKGAVNECWLWKSSTNSGGYGQIKHEGQMKEVHRLLFTEIIKPPMNEYQVNHLCRNKNCVNPNHLYLGSQKTNIIDHVLNDELETKITMDEFFQIKDLLENTSFTQQEIADFYEISQSYIHKINVDKIGKSFEIQKRLEGTVHEQH